MTGAIARYYASLPTPAKLLLILSLVLLPIGAALYAIADSGIRRANEALLERTHAQSRAASKAIESLVARNVLALRVAANGGLMGGSEGACARALRSLSIAPGVSQQFEIADLDGNRLCNVGEVGDTSAVPVIAPGDKRLVVAPARDGIIYRVGVIGGMATSRISAAEMRETVTGASEAINDMVITDGERRVSIIASPDDDDPTMQAAASEWPISGDLKAQVTGLIPRVTTIERLLLLLPMLMWVIAALLTWWLVTRVLIRPLRTLQRAVSDLQPGESGSQLPTRLGPAREIGELRDAFARAVDRIEHSERDMASALEGQRRLVREVHHRVKNNLQVVASMLNIHGRNAADPQARAAYDSIGRRVGALSVVHRNHFAEMEENRGIALRPLITELAAELRAGAPPEARNMIIDLEVDSIHTTQDVAVAIAFFVTEIVEMAMLKLPGDPIEVSVRRASELTARLTLASPILVPADADLPEKVHFERIVAGLAKQLRSPLERKLGRYSVDLPAFPPA